MDGYVEIDDDLLVDNSDKTNKMRNQIREVMFVIESNCEKPNELPAVKKVVIESTSSARSTMNNKSVKSPESKLNERIKKIEKYASHLRENISNSNQFAPIRSQSPVKKEDINNAEQEFESMLIKHDNRNLEAKLILFNLFEIENKDEYEKNKRLYLCNFCKNLIFEAVRCQGCFFLFCKHCYDNYQSTKKTCPRKCGQSYSTPSAEITEYHKDILDSLKLRCICSELVTLTESVIHIQECKKIGEKCCWNCSNPVREDRLKFKENKVIEIYKGLSEIRLFELHSDYWLNNFKLLEYIKSHSREKFELQEDILVLNKKIKTKKFIDEQIKLLSNLWGSGQTIEELEKELYQKNESYHKITSKIRGSLDLLKKTEERKQSNLENFREIE